MAPSRNHDDLSELEREFELDMRDEGDDREFESLSDTYEEAARERAEFDPDVSRYVDRLVSLSTRRFESEREVDEAVSDVLTEMERDFFFKGLMKKVTGAGKSLLKKGASLATGAIGQGVRTATQLARDGLRGQLGSLARMGLSAALGTTPFGQLLPVLMAMGVGGERGFAPQPDAAIPQAGFGAGGGGLDPDLLRQLWQAFSQVSREAYDYLAQNLDERSDQPLAASMLASRALQAGLQRAQDRPRGGTRSRLIRVRSGERIVIEGV